MFELVVHSGDSNYVSNPHLLMVGHGRLVSITSRSINRSADPSFSIVRAWSLTAAIKDCWRKSYVMPVH